MQKDIRNIDRGDVKGFDIICHLAAVSGYPACEANPHAAQMVNVEATRRLTKLLTSSQILVYASTTSIYGDSRTVCDETAPLKAVSLYAITKYEAEKIVMRRGNSIALRFATLFGVSPKMRNDLMPNDFVHRAITDRSLVLFDSRSIRTFLHIDDAIRTYLMVIKMPKKMCGEVFNVGSNRMNLSKLDLARKIREFVRFEIIESNIADLDKRDFIINYGKIAKLGFKPLISLDRGIKELVKLYSFYRPFSSFRII